MGPVLTIEITYIEIMNGYGSFDPMDPNEVTQSEFGKFFLCFFDLLWCPLAIGRPYKRTNFQTNHSLGTKLALHSLRKEACPFITKKLQLNVRLNSHKDKSEPWIGFYGEL